MKDVNSWLADLGLSQYAGILAEAAIDWDVLPDLSEQDLAGLGIPLGHRKRLLKAILLLRPRRGSIGAQGKAAPADMSPVPERRYLTVMFCDLVGSTALSHRLDPEELRPIIRAYQDCCAGIISSMDGFICRYIGDGILVYFGYPFFLQVSLSYWRHKHLVVHHPNPNLIGRDADVDLAPYFVLTQEALKSASGLRRWFYDHQWMFVPFVLFFNSFNVILAGWIYLIRQLRSGKTRQLKHWLDLLALLLHVAVWVALPLAYFSAADVMVFTIARLGLTSYGMFALFAPAHFPAEAVFLDRDIDADDPVWRYTATTVNFRTGPLGRLLCAGVEYQIEHHLFPSISHVWYPQLSELVQRFCEARGYPYRTLGWWEAIWKSLMVFRHPKPIFHDAEKVTEALFHRGAENAMPGVVTPSFSERLNQARPVR